MDGTCEWVHFDVDQDINPDLADLNMFCMFFLLCAVWAGFFFRGALQFILSFTDDQQKGDDMKREMGKNREQRSPVWQLSCLWLAYPDIPSPQTTSILVPKPYQCLVVIFYKEVLFIAEGLLLNHEATRANTRSRFWPPDRWRANI